ncbi:hypothetical protein O5O45_26620 [Hahella aquimaris]|uniref:imm11 family protein n=1 Tax=Hahella sp. HNIBRBA332 TaxID=3015983 RepID=UPI00273ACAF6|nr:DUF1629 domain-containing protein [Hahella sp. HNIBRBA332]WLQ13301.1 hypothetical protein O5O45_26620 [Hahella sp. HNIBRBA332]
MTKRYFNVMQDMTRTDLTYIDKLRWNLDEDFQFWWLCKGNYYSGPAPLKAEVEIQGTLLAFNLTYLEVPIVEKTLAEKLVSLGVEAQLIPIEVDGLNGQWVVMNFLQCIDCLDKEKSIVELWKEEDGVPHKVGQYYAVPVLVVDPNKVSPEVKAFRIQNWEGLLFVDQVIKECLESWPNQALIFEEKTPRTQLQSVK